MKTCDREGCTNQFKPIRVTGRFCSVQCRQKYYNHRRSAEYNREHNRRRNETSKWERKREDIIGYKLPKELTFIHSDIPSNNGLTFDEQIRKINGLA